ncbi:uncharacterized protein F5Z01DRAFT_502579 [Emericellopsis atlantica]|uniref:Uncharacterized protein n=1 Tax=Emericellopsis atlantica TaxID=2614577 RepID=A0A9P7ZQ51_9HYPO|nr:uncharacterized protein F5Z01DRAFT_502579 [Emericellopsis atlantica]KAG9256253.1 hypothetical protein F5Z01DRAFT_502579 [Emericellopsis atlantica]
MRETWSPDPLLQHCKGPRTHGPQLPLLVEVGILEQLLKTALGNAMWLLAVRRRLDREHGVVAPITPADQSRQNTFGGEGVGLDVRHGLLLLLVGELVDNGVKDVGEIVQAVDNGLAVVNEAFQVRGGRGGLRILGAVETVKLLLGHPDRQPQVLKDLHQAGNVELNVRELASAVTLLVRHAVGLNDTGDQSGRILHAGAQRVQRRDETGKNSLDSVFPVWVNFFNKFQGRLGALKDRLECLPQPGLVRVVHLVAPLVVRKHGGDVLKDLRALGLVFLIVALGPAHHVVDGDVDAALLARRLVALGLGLSGNVLEQLRALGLVVLALTLGPTQHVVPRDGDAALVVFGLLQFRPLVVDGMEDVLGGEIGTVVRSLVAGGLAGLASLVLSNNLLVNTSLLNGISLLGSVGRLTDGLAIVLADTDGLAVVLVVTLATRTHATLDLALAEVVHKLEQKLGVVFLKVGNLVLMTLPLAQIWLLQVVQDVGAWACFLAFIREDHHIDSLRHGLIAGNADDAGRGHWQGRSHCNGKVWMHFGSLVGDRVVL